MLTTSKGVCAQEVAGSAVTHGAFRVLSAALAAARSFAGLSPTRQLTVIYYSPNFHKDTHRWLSPG